MASITRQRRDADRQSGSEQRLLDAVERLLNAGQLFTEISVQRILEEAGVSRATFYAHFRDKSALLIRLTDTLRERLLDLARAWDPAAGEDGAARYAEFFLEVIRIHRENFAVLSAVRELASYDPAVHDFYTADLDEFERAVCQTLTEQQRSGATISELSPVAASRVIVWGGAQAIAHHISVDDGSGDTQFARELGAIWWHGAYRRPAP
ncbi:TetR/AcrR family transcriptional regulator [Mycobacterium sp. 3519A]|uniref:TetR/AcrR family transcriptional regulator n=1 Tax=Mycobacterium sp. 3519A TaxID=2057184 RepID=UPI00190EAA29|nr:TetR/AcrR family transcriptional regulator [Mycobacterium sp. 3519A]